MKPLTYQESARLQFQLEAKEQYLMGSDEYNKCFLCGDYMMKEATVMIFGETVCTDNCIGGVIEEGESTHELVYKHQKLMGKLSKPVTEDVFGVLGDILRPIDMRVYANELLGNINGICNEFKKK